jgi:transaldolase
VTKLHDLYAQRGRALGSTTSTGPASKEGWLQKLVDVGIRGVTSNPTIFQKAMTGSEAYDEQFRDLIAT